MHYLCLASCLEVNKPEKIYFHYQHLPYGEWWDRIAPHITLCKVTNSNFIETFEYKNKAVEIFRYAHISDIIRLEVLLKYGGVYADMDTLFVKKIPDTLYLHDCVMGKEMVNWQETMAQKAGGSLCNAFIMAAPQSVFIQQWLQEIHQYFDGSWSGHSTFLPYILSQKPEAAVHVEPQSSFFHFGWNKKGIHNLFMNHPLHREDIYSMHLWAHLWWSYSRTDFSYFSHLELTPAYVAFANTTYATIAKQFLPGDIFTTRQQYEQERKRFARKHLWLHTKSRLKNALRKITF
ncbi:hypothetical protein FLA_3549 [Filimonas lacunae]|nr:hypothetical protein FLA_3549 [Filimonas lacunae]